MIFPKELINYNNNLYFVYRKVKRDLIKEDYVQDIKKYWSCDVVVKHRNQNDDLLLFLKEISEAELAD